MPKIDEVMAHLDKHLNADKHYRECRENCKNVVIYLIDFCNTNDVTWKQATRRMISIFENDLKRKAV